ncbi:unnamed protein product [Trichobilharzia regenti]|nr:unnamed protein product [Trichobilharzia regenti]
MIPSESSFKSKDEAKAFLKRLCDQVLTVHVSDGRKEYPSPSDSQFDILERELTTVVIPGQHITKVECRGDANIVSFTVIIIKLIFIPSRFISISLVFINKWLLSDKSVSLKAPLFITWFQCIVTALLCYLASYAALLLPSRVKFPQLNFSVRTSIEVGYTLSMN